MDFVSKPIVIGLAVIVLLMAGYIAYLSVVNATQKTEIAIAKANLAVFTQANDELKNSIIKYDAAMKVLRDQTAARAKQVQKELDAAKVKTKRYESIADNIRKLKPITKDDCRNAQGLLKTYLRGNK